MIFLLTLLWLLPVKPAVAATYQQCPVSSTCTIGEWLYDDEYQPQTGAVCTLTAKYPDGSDFLTASASATADAWYYYDAAIGTTEGLYPANLCCSVGSDYLCLDKSFEVKAAGAALTAADVWASSSRSLTSFGSLATDVWNNSTRSLTSFGDLISNVWNYSTTTTNTPAVITNIVQEQTEQRELLEKLVNAPVVSLSLEEGRSIPDLNTKLEQSRTQANALYEAIQSGKINNPELLTLAEAWDAPIILELNLAASLKNLALLSELVGEPGNDSQEPTLFGFLAKVSERNDSLKAESQKLAVLLDDWNGLGESVLDRAIVNSRKQVLVLNEYPGGDQLLQPTKTSQDQKLNLKNLVFNLQALLGLNRQILAINAGESVRALWLEEGSIIFRGVITNPSAVISQTVPLKFYLPRELKTEDILTLDPSLETHYDTTEEALFVTGSYTLAPEETRLVFVEVEDVWQLIAGELETIKKQAAELLKPLEKTSYFSQGTVLKSQIDVNLDKILLTQSKAITPENRIRAYREARLELNGINTNIQRLQDLVAQASGTGSIFGFVGGVQTVAVWGILLVVIASFVFLTIYMRQLKSRPAKAPAAPKPPAIPWSNPVLIPAVILATAIITVMITQLILKPKTAPATILQVIEPSPLASPSLKPQEINIKQEKQVLGTATPKHLTVPADSSVNIRSRPSLDAQVVMRLKTSVDIFVFEQNSDWSRVGFSPDDLKQSWWVSSQFLD
ncbi:hypothetical protein CO018_02550 [Candidatus Beckwithbacteria bacterium CG_4_9_14_0_2_um_filter_47_11]|uniref:SH3b domain-containing protein n=2 Tax=Candidatus Beckwithiibacteriota TaxID=1752726 RepID=A0A2M8G3X0_9BACT|nr:MAG: hypothetical protein CO018_02550 [Candidatus Beckwithbacteria bacterium CG_4_9_14_0_2_um_filter_47_11]